ncbi:unnamed protein product [Parnassius apollo]|uniref:(apollo) hypothetical protein n=1 Tax=Parnassius apollo TaxID=110799 RepID=A0A8S3X6Q3_PARAO|nr:unnamed protein product [Parnassius apollo]
MDMELLETNGKYVLPLDTVDLSLLSTLNVAPKHHNDLLPLWSKSNLRLRNEDCYLEFEIQDQQDISDTDTYYDETEFEVDDKEDISESEATYVSPTENSSNPDVDGEIGTNFCYICNIEVPLPFMKEHIDSSKHKTFLKITEVALERVKKQMGFNFSSKNSVPSMYFCQTCVTTTPVKDKSFHMKSNAHKNAVILDKLLNDFLKIYTHEKLEKDKTESDIETSNHEGLDKVINKMSNANSTVICSDEVTNIPDIEKPVYNKDTAEEIASKLIPITVPKVNKNTIVNGGTNLTEYINILNAKTFSTHKLKDVNGDYFIIETKDGSQLKVTHNHFHGVLAMGKRHAQCKLCTEIVRNLDEHICSQKHIEKLVLPINDKECIRELDNTKSHCILCNELVENDVDFHIHNKRHQALLQNAILSENESTSQIKLETQSDVHKTNITALEINEEQKPKYCAAKTADDNINNAQSELEKNEGVVQLDVSKSKTFFCSICYITLHSNNIHSHASGIRHKTNEKHIYHYLIEYSIEADNLKCKVCNCLVDTHHTVHLTSTDHADRYNALLAENKMFKTENHVFCKACTVYIRIENELVHIDSTKHKRLLLNLKSEIIDQPTKGNIITKATGNDIKQHFCVVCQVNVPNNAHNISTHYNGKLHKHNLANYHKSNKIDKGHEKLASVSKNDKEKASVNPPAEIFSKDTPSGSTAKNIPVVEQNGKINIKKDTNPNSVIQTASRHDNKNSISVTSETAIAEDILEITINPKELKCRICLVIIPNKTENIQEHVNGYNHNNNAAILLVQNRLKLTGNQYFCDGCREPVTVGDQFDHINKRSHAVNMVRTLTNDIVNAFAENQDHTDTESNTGSSIIKGQALKVSHSSSEKIQQKYFEIKLTNKPGEVNCQVCCVKVPSSVSTLKMHIGGRKHVTMLQEMLSKNKIQVKSDCFNCLVCQMDMKKYALFNHVQNETHVAALTKTKRNSICKVCNIAIIKETMAEHVLTVQHINNQKKKNEMSSHMCEICDVQLTNNATNIDEHNNGSQHKNNLKQLELNNIEIKEGEMKEKCYCNTCGVYFTCKSFQEHIRTSQHLILSGTGL